MKRITQTMLALSTVSWMIAAAVGFSPSNAQADAPQSESPNTTIIYFLRHSEDVPEMVGSDPTFTVNFTMTNDAGTCRVEALNPLGKMRATALAGWFETKNITRTLTHVIATHKLRTRQTVAPIAYAAGLGGDLNGDGIPDGADVDQAPGDGVINIPPTPAECDPGWTSSSSVKQPQIDYIKTLPVGSRAVVCSHSPTLYPIMRAFGIDTSDPVKFPKTGTPNTTSERVKGFNNVWVVELNPVEIGGVLTYQGRLLEHSLLDFELSVSLINRDHGNEPSHPAKDDEE